MKHLQGAANLRVLEPCEPAGLPYRQVMRVAAQDFDVEQFGQAREDRLTSRLNFCGLGQEVIERSRQPRPRIRR